MTKERLLRAFSHLWVARAILRIGGPEALAVPTTAEALSFHLDEAQKALTG